MLVEETYLALQGVATEEGLTRFTGYGVKVASQRLIPAHTTHLVIFITPASNIKKKEKTLLVPPKMLLQHHLISLQ